MHTPWFARKTKFLAVSLATLVSTMLYAGAAWADTFTVTNTSNSGAGSLREAINKANLRAGADQIVFAEGVGGTITLASTLPTITDGAGLAIDGGGDVTVSGNDSVRVFEVQSGARLSLSKLTITDGITNEFSSGIQPGLGGGIHNVGTLTVTNSTLSGNIAGSGGAIANDGGTLTVANATIFSNHAANGGGGIRNGILNSGTITLMNSTVSENTSRVVAVVAVVAASSAVVSAQQSR